MASEKEGQIDLDESRIFINGEWLSEEELKYSIKTKVSSDDFDIAPIAMSLKTLAKAIENSREMKVRLSSDMAEQLETYAKKKGETPGSVIRDAVIAFMGGEISVPKKEEKEEEPEEKKEAPPPLIPIPTKKDEEEEEEEEEEDEEEEEEDEDEDEEEEEEDEPSSRRSRRGGRRRRRHID